MALDDLLGFDPDDPQQELALMLAQQDQQLIRHLVQLREQEMSQQEVAERLGVSVESVQEFERSGGDPRLSEIRRYALAIGVLVGHYVSEYWWLEKHWRDSGS